MNEETPKAIIRFATSAYVFQSLPNASGNDVVGDMVEYTPKTETIDVRRDGNVLYFSPKMTVTNKLLSVQFDNGTDTQKLLGNGILIQKGSPTTAQYVIELKDFGGYNVGTLSYGFTSFPMEYNNDPNDENFGQVKTWSKMAKFNLPSSDRNGYDCPCGVKVIPLGSASDEDGQIYVAVTRLSGIEG